MPRNIACISALCMSLGISVCASAAEKAWVTESNSYTKPLIDIEHQHNPESGSQEGLAVYDEKISVPTLADELAERRELEAAMAKLKSYPPQTDKLVLQDLEILQKAFNIRFRSQDYALSHKVIFLNASQMVFEGLRTLLDDQVADERRPAARVRLRKYAGAESGFKPYTELLKQRTLDQMAKPGVIFPSKVKIETDLGRNSNYVDGIAELFRKYKLEGWEPAYAQLKDQLSAYDQWIRDTVLPKARTDFRVPPEEYKLALERYGVDLPPDQLTALAHTAFAETQSRMATLAAQIAKNNGYPSSDYRSVIHELKKKQITGTDIVPFYENRLHEIERIITANNLVTLPNRPAIIRLASAAETAAQPAAHMVSPPLVHNTGERGEFVLPLKIPSENGGAANQYDDFTVDAVAWSMTAHEARPGHELQFDSMIENGVSLARALYAFNSTNVEGWGLYSEYIMEPYEPLEGQLFTEQLRMLRDARAFLDPELQSGKVTPEQAYAVLENDVVISHAFAKEEVERFTIRTPGQANSYFYGYTRLLALRKEVEAAQGAAFNQKEFHDFILSQGLLPPDVLRKAVLARFASKQH
jgi:Bacterial protein of unknown function (DUF885)